MSSTPATTTLTNGDVLVFRVLNENPKRYNPGEFTMTCIKEKDGKRVGTSGQMEPAAVYKVETPSIEPFNITLALRRGHHHQLESEGFVLMGSPPFERRFSMDELSGD